MTMSLTVRETEAKSILTKSNLPLGGWSANPYTGCAHACRYCYASFMKRFTNHPEPWGGFVDVKHWPAIKRPGRYAGQKIFIGSVTDPYQPLEKKFKRTRALFEELRGSGAKLSIATKSDLVLRDLDLIKTFPDARVSWSVNTLDEAFRSDMDRAAPVERRLEAMRAFYKAGVRTVCFVSPVFPGITDVPAIIQRVRGQCSLIWLENLNLRGGYKQDIMNYIRDRRPELLPLYRAIYEKGDRGYWEVLDEEIRALAADEGLEYLRDDDSFSRPFDAPPVIVNFFYHEQIIPSAKAAGQIKIQNPGKGGVLH